MTASSPHWRVQLRLYPFHFVLQFRDWYERRYGREPSDVLLAVVGQLVIWLWVVLMLALVSYGGFDES